MRAGTRGRQWEEEERPHKMNPGFAVTGASSGLVSQSSKSLETQSLPLRPIKEPPPWGSCEG